VVHEEKSHKNSIFILKLFHCGKSLRLICFHEDRDSHVKLELSNSNRLAGLMANVTMNFKVSTHAIHLINVLMY